MRPSPIALWLSAFLMAASLVQAKVKQADCSFTTFTAPSGYSIAAVGGIDDNGYVVGQLQENKSGNVVGFIRSADGTFTTYAVPKSYTTMFNHRLNNAVTVGSYQDHKLNIHGFVYTAGNEVAVNYPKAAQSWLNGINNAGTVVGAFIEGVHSKGFQLANGTYTEVAYSGALNTQLESINDNGLVVGYYQDATLDHGITWQNGKFQVVDYPVTKYGTMLIDVNQAGVIVGNQYSGDFASGFFYSKSGFSKVVYSGAKAASIGGINNNGVISGQIFFKGGNQPGYTAVCK